MACDPKKTLRSCLAFQRYWKDRPKKQIPWGPDCSWSDPPAHLKAVHELNGAQCTANGVEFPCPYCMGTGIVFWNGRWGCRSTRSDSSTCRKVISTVIQDIRLGDRSSLGADPNPMTHCWMCCLRVECATCDSLIVPFMCEGHRTIQTMSVADFDPTDIPSAFRKFLRSWSF